MCVQAKVVEGSFDNNNIAVQQALDELRDDSADVRQVKDHLQEIKKTKVSMTYFKDCMSDNLKIA